MKRRPRRTYSSLIVQVDLKRSYMPHSLRVPSSLCSPMLGTKSSKHGSLADIQSWKYSKYIHFKFGKHFYIFFVSVSLQNLWFGKYRHTHTETHTHWFLWVLLSSFPAATASSDPFCTLQRCLLPSVLLYFTL